MDRRDGFQEEDVQVSPTFERQEEKGRVRGRTLCICVCACTQPEMPPILLPSFGSDGHIDL
jgi:hypothetical protein